MDSYINFDDVFNMNMSNGIFNVLDSNVGKVNI